MLKPSSRPDLSQETFRAKHGCELRAQHLQGHWPVVLNVMREIDRGHAPAPELALDRVAVAQGVDQLGGHPFDQAQSFKIGGMLRICAVPPLKLVQG